MTLDDVIAAAKLRADRLMHRESTDFLGRMNETLMEGEAEFEDDPSICRDLEAYRAAMIELAALALAQAAMTVPRP